MKFALKNDTNLLDINITAKNNILCRIKSQKYLKMKKRAKRVILKIVEIK